MFKAIWKFITAFKYRPIATGIVRCSMGENFRIVFFMNGFGRRKYKILAPKWQMRYIFKGKDYVEIYVWKLGGALPEGSKYIEIGFDNLIATYFTHKLTLGDKS